MQCQRRVVGSVRAALAGLAVLATAAGAAPAAAPEPVPPIAVIDGHAVTVGDANALRAILSPPPSQDAAERLAVDIALVWWSEHGTLVGSAPKERLTAWREWLLEVDKSVPPGGLGREVVERLAVIRARLESVDADSDSATCERPLEGDVETQP